MLAAEHATGSGNTRLHLVGNEQHVVLVAEVEALFKIAVVGHEHTCLALNGFSNKGTNLIAIFVEGFAQGVYIIIRNAYETWRERAILSIRARVVAHSDDRDGAPVEVTIAANNLDFIVVDAFLHSTPAAGKFQSGLNTFGTGVHRKDAIIAEEVVHELLVLAKGIVIEGS